eukprot:13929851-Ditylum_brightwellii.AAC.1
MIVDPTLSLESAFLWGSVDAYRGGLEFDLTIGISMGLDPTFTEDCASSEKLHGESLPSSVFVRKTAKSSELAFFTDRNCCTSDVDQ